MVTGAWRTHHQRVQVVLLLPILLLIRPFEVVGHVYVHTVILQKKLLGSTKQRRD